MTPNRCGRTTANASSLRRHARAIQSCSSDVKLLVKNDSCNVDAMVSPDGHWMAYTSYGSSGMSRGPEMYVERYPELGDRTQISTGGGDVAVWSQDGQELFFMAPD